MTDFDEAIRRNLEKRRHYVYSQAYPESMGGCVFYIGKGTGRRVDVHERQAKGGYGKNPHKHNVIRKILREGGQVVKTKLAFFETHEEALQYEIALIFFMNGLTNVTNGGEGVMGLVHSEEARRKISETGKGRIASEEARRNMSLAQKGRPYRPQSEKHQRKIREAITGKKRSEQSCRNMSEAHKGITHSEQARRKISEVQQGRIHTTETRQKMSEAHKGRIVSEETRRKLSEAHKGKVMSEEARQKMSDAHKGRPSPNTGRRHSIETRRKLSDAHKGRPGHPQSEEARRKIGEASNKRRAIQKQGAISA